MNNKVKYHKYNIIQTFGVSKISFLRIKCFFVKQWHIKFIKSDSKDVYIVTKYLYLKKKMYPSFHKNMKQHNCFQRW